MAKTMFCFNKSSAKNESQTIISITQKHHYKTRLAAQQNYFQPRKRIELGKKTFSYIGPKIWQEVPFELKSLSYNQFKKKFKLFFNWSILDKMPQQFDEVSWHVKIYLITTNITIKSLLFF